MCYVCTAAWAGIMKGMRVCFEEKLSMTHCMSLSMVSHSHRSLSNHALPLPVGRLSSTWFLRAWSRERRNRWIAIYGQKSI